jgi:para-nitrobenzyl esterase
MRGAFLFASPLLAALLCACPPEGTPPVEDAGAPGEDAGPTERCPTDLAASTSRVITSEGAVRGIEVDTAVTFLGIPYAAPTDGEQRFRPPQPPACYDRELVATTYGERCPQLINGIYLGDEDCLNLNVFAPAGAPSSDERLPVLFFVHGGANVFGSSGDQLTDGTRIYDGSVLAAENDVVVVTVNYRLGSLGFLVHEGLDAEDERGTSGNQALLDLVQALTWVQDNIAVFGGDPDRVLLFGESAGALNTCALMSSPRASGLFSAALMQSGGCTAPDKSTRLSTTRELESLTSCAAGDDAGKLACLRSLDAETLTRAPLYAAPNADPWSLTAGPVVDGDVLTGSPIEVIAAGQHNEVPLVIGSNTEETKIWAPTMADCAAYESVVRNQLGLDADAVLAVYPCADFPTPEDAWTALSTDVTFTCPARAIARAGAAGQQAPVFRYVYARPGLGISAPLGAYHAAELPFVFGHLFIQGFPPSQAAIDTSATIREYWSSHARDGAPSASDAPSWPPWDDTEPYLLIDDTVEVGADFRATACDLWDSLAP